MVYQNQIKEAVEAIVSSIHPISIVLFGSVARKGKGNDLDLMIVNGCARRASRSIGPLGR